MHVRLTVCDLGERMHEQARMHCTGMQPALGDREM
jgi:hypothetical protein